MQADYATDECIVQPWRVNESRYVTLRLAVVAVIVTAAISSPSLLFLCKHPPSIPSCVHGVNCVTSPPVCTAGPHFALANNDHQGRGEYNEVDKSSTMMMDCVAIEARGLKQALLRDPRYWEDSTRPAGAIALFRLRFHSLYFRGMISSVIHGRSQWGARLH